MGRNRNVNIGACCCLVAFVSIVVSICRVALYEHTIWWRNDDDNNNKEDHKNAAVLWSPLSTAEERKGNGGAVAPQLCNNDNGNVGTKPESTTKMMFRQEYDTSKTISPEIATSDDDECTNSATNPTTSTNASTPVQHRPGEANNFYWEPWGQRHRGRDEQQLYQQQQLPAELRSGCSCWNERYTCDTFWNSSNETCWRKTRVCCNRTWYAMHKMGDRLSAELIRPTKQTGVVLNPNLARDVREHHNGSNNNNASRPQPFLGSSSSPFTNRNVVVTRNLIDALVSGYLYHKSGRECTRNSYGVNLPKGSYMFLHQLDWEQELARPLDYTPWRNGSTDQSYYWQLGRRRGWRHRRRRRRGICQYLAEETSETVGMRVYADFALGRWYAPVFDYWEQVSKMHAEEQSSLLANKQQEQLGQQHKLQQLQPQPPPPSTMFVCFERLTDPVTKRETFRDAMDFLFPSGWYYDGRFDPPPSRQEQQQHHSYAFVGSASHATDHDPELRARLAAILRGLDEDVFDHWIKRFNGIFGCRSSI